MSKIDVVKAVKEGIDYAPTAGERWQVVLEQQARVLEHAAFLSTRLDLTIPDVYGAQALLGAKGINVAEMRGFREMVENGELSTDAVRDAAMASRELRRTNIAIVPSGPPSRFDGQTALAQELQMRGANVRFLNGERMRVRGGELQYQFDDGAWRKIEKPDAIIGRGVKRATLQPLQKQGVHFLNAPTTRIVTTNKSIQADLFKANGVLHPDTIGHLKSRSAIRDAVERMVARRDDGEYLAVIKADSGYGGKGVWIIRKPEDVEKMLAGTVERTVKGEQVTQELVNGRRGFLVQEYKEVGSADFRFSVIRDPDGSVHVREVHHRQGKDGKANGSAGSVYTRIAVRKVDPEAARLAKIATDAAGLDSGGVDVVRTADGKWMVLEVNGTSGIAEHDVPVANAERTLPYMANWLMYGQQQQRIRNF